MFQIYFALVLYSANIITRNSFWTKL